MEIARIRVHQTALELEQSTPVTRGMVGAALVFEHFGPEWAGLSKTAVFRTGAASRDVVNVQEGEPVVIPREVLETALTDLHAGICGHSSDGTLVIPTVWVSLGKIASGAVPVGRPSEPPTPDWTEQIEGQVNQALTEAQAVRPLAQQAADAVSAANESAASAASSARLAANAVQNARHQADKSLESANVADKALRLSIENAKAAMEAQNAAAGSAEHAASCARTASEDAQAAVSHRNRAEAEANRAQGYSDRMGDMVAVNTSLGVHDAKIGQAFRVAETDELGRVTRWEPVSIPGLGDMELLAALKVDKSNISSTYKWTIPRCSSVILTTLCKGYAAEKDIYADVYIGDGSNSGTITNQFYASWSSHFATRNVMDLVNGAFQGYGASGPVPGLCQPAAMAEPDRVTKASYLDTVQCTNYNGNFFLNTVFEVWGARI